jgi:hypothetical protein
VFSVNWKSDILEYGPDSRVGTATNYLIQTDQKHPLCLCVFVFFELVRIRPDVFLVQGEPAEAD